MGALPVAGSDEQKRTNEIGMAIPLLETCDIAGKVITGDALLTQRAIATHVVQQQAHYHFTVKGNQPTLESDIALLFKDRSAPDYTELSPPDHGRIETRRIWCSTELNAYLDSSATGTTMRTEAESEPASARRTSLAFAASPWASSSPFRNAASPSPR